MFKHGVSIRRQLLRLGFDPVVTLVELARSTEDEEVRRKICAELISYCHTKPSRNGAKAGKKKPGETVGEAMTTEDLLTIVKGQA